ncbi:unnamed protein product, partial [marine sediment metagenome]
QGGVNAHQSGVSTAMQITQGNLPVYFYIYPMTIALNRVGKLLEKLIPEIYIENRTIVKGDNIYSINGDDENSLNFANTQENHSYGIKVKSSASFEIQRQNYLHSMITIFQASPPEMKALLAPQIFELMKLPNLPELNDIYDKFIAMSAPQLYPILKEKDPKKVEQSIAQTRQQQQAAQHSAQSQQQQAAALEQQLKIKDMQLREESLELEKQKLALQLRKQQAEEVESIGKHHIESEKIDNSQKEVNAKLATDVIKSHAEIKKSMIDSKVHN